MWSTAELMLTASKPLSSPKQRTAENRGWGRWSAGEMGGVADMQVCFGVKLIQNLRPLLMNQFCILLL